MPARWIRLAKVWSCDEVVLSVCLWGDRWWHHLYSYSIPHYPQPACSGGAVRRSPRHQPAANPAGAPLADDLRFCCRWWAGGLCGRLVCAAAADAVLAGGTLPAALGRFRHLDIELCGG